MLAKLGKIGTEKLPQPKPTSNQMEKEEESIWKKESSEPTVKRIERAYDQEKEELMTMNTIFPFDFFPDHIVIDSKKIVINKSIFFFSGSITTTLVKDITGAYAEEGPIFATLKIVTTKDKEHPVKIAPLKKKDAEKAMGIINGLVLERTEKPEVVKLENSR